MHKWKMLSLLCLCVDLSFKNKVISIPRLWCSWCHHMSINAAKSGLGVRDCEQLWLVICFSPCHLFYLVHAIWDSTLKVQYWLTSYPGCRGGEKHFSPPTQLVRLTSSLVPRPSIISIAVEGLVKLVCRMTSGGRLEAWHFRWTAVLCMHGAW